MLGLGYVRSFQKGERRLRACVCALLVDLLTGRLSDEKCTILTLVPVNLPSSYRNSYTPDVMITISLLLEIHDRPKAVLPISHFLLSLPTYHIRRL